MKTQAIPSGAGVTSEFGFALVQGDRRYWIDTMTGTFGDCNDLVLFNDPPEDFEDWSDGDRVRWVNAQNGVGA